MRGIYQVLSQDRRLVYVGSSLNLEARRRAHGTVATRLGCVMEVIEEMPGASRAELYDREDWYIESFRSEGLGVVNLTNREMQSEKGKRARASNPQVAARVCSQNSLRAHRLHPGMRSETAKRTQALYPEISIRLVEEGKRNAGLGLHHRWHVVRGIKKEGCLWCEDGASKKETQ